MGFFSGIKKVFSNPVRAAEAIGTFGTSEIARSALGGMDPLAVAAPIGLGFATGNPMMGAQIAGGIYSGYQNAQMQKDANAQNTALAQKQMIFSAQQAQNQMNFQERMSNTAISRAQKDMLEAGINPMLAPTAQMSSPAGAMGSYNPAHVEAVPSVANYALNSAKDAVKMYQDVAESKSRVDANAARAGVDLKTSEEKSVWATLSSGMNKILKAMFSDAKAVYRAPMGKKSSALDTTPDGEPIHMEWRK